MEGRLGAGPRHVCLCPAHAPAESGQVSVPGLWSWDRAGTDPCPHLLRFPGAPAPAGRPSPGPPCLSPSLPLRPQQPRSSLDQFFTPLLLRFAGFFSLSSTVLTLLHNLVKPLSLWEVPAFVLLGKIPGL